LIDTEEPWIDARASERQVLNRVRRHWVVLAWYLVWPALVALLIAAVDWGWGHASNVVTWGGLIVIAVLALVAWLRWYFEWITLTNERVVLERGVIVRSIRVIPLDHIQDIYTRQSILGRLLGFGTIEIDAIGREGIEQVRGAPRPDLIRERVFEQQRLMVGENPRPGNGITTQPPRRR
jgi:uncharacterized membrane protein YdbT with pleckstrin-like domain